MDIIVPREMGLSNGLRSACQSNKGSEHPKYIEVQDVPSVGLSGCGPLVSFEVAMCSHKSLHSVFGCAGKSCCGSCFL